MAKYILMDEAAPKKDTRPTGPNNAYVRMRSETEKLPPEYEGSDYGDTPDPKQFAAAGIPLSEATRGQVPRPQPKALAPAAPQGKFLNTFDSRDDNYLLRNGGVAGTAMTALEMIKGLAQMAPKGTADDVIKWVDKHKERFWASPELGGFFGDTAAELGRASANMLVSTLAGRGLSSAVPGAAGMVGKMIPSAAGKVLPGALSAKAGAGELARKLMHTFTGQVATAGGVGAGTAAIQEAQEGTSKLEQAAMGALTGALVQGGIGILPAASDLIKQHVGSSGQKLWKQLIPLFGKSEVNAPNPKLNTPAFKAGQALETQTKTPLTIGQKSGDFDQINKERTALQQGLTEWQELGRKQAAGTERVAQGAMVASPGPTEVGKGLQRVSGEIGRGLTEIRQQNWDLITKAAGGDPDARNMVMLPYVRGLLELKKEHNLKISPKENEAILSAINRRLEQMLTMVASAKDPTKLVPKVQSGTGREVTALMSEQTKAAFSAGDRGLAADWHVASVLKDAMDDVIKENVRLGNPVAKGLQAARNQWHADSGKLDAFGKTLLAKGLRESESPEAALQLILGSKSPSEVATAMRYLDSAEPYLSSAVRQEYIRNLVSRGITTKNPLTNSTFSPTAFSQGKPAGRSAQLPDELVMDAILTKSDKAALAKAYDLAGRTALHEPNPQASYAVEQTRQGQITQAGGAVLSGQGSGSVPYVGRSIALTGYPALIRKYLVNPEGQQDLQRLTPWNAGRNVYSHQPGAVGGVVGTLTSPDVPSEPTLGGLDGPMLTNPTELEIQGKRYFLKD